MPFSATPRSLVVYSNPISFSRLRLDLEHKAIEDVLSKYNFPQGIIRIIQAASILDVGKALREQEYEVVFFSCHGGSDGLYLEGKSDESETSWGLISRTLKEGAPTLSALILNACYSITAQNELHAAAPFLIVMDGEADDDAAVAFSKHFFDEFYRSSSVDHAFHLATSYLDQMGMSDKIKPVLCRRQPAGHSVVQACFSRRQDSIFIDLSEAEKSISELPVDRYTFLSILTRKIRVHSWIFKIERERVVIPIGHFFGVFSWKNAKDVVVCHKVLQLRPDLDQSECMGWTRLMVVYNDLRSERYRAVEYPSAHENQGLLAAALDNVESCLDTSILVDEVKIPACKLAHIQYAVTIATVRAQCHVARKNLNHLDLKRVVFALETAISSIHDLVNELTSAVTVHLPEERKDNAGYQQI